MFYIKKLNTTFKRIIIFLLFQMIEQIYSKPAINQIPYLQENEHLQNINNIPTLVKSLSNEYQPNILGLVGSIRDRSQNIVPTANQQLPTLPVIIKVFNEGLPKVVRNLSNRSFKTTGIEEPRHTIRDHRDKYHHNTEHGHKEKSKEEIEKQQEMLFRHFLNDPEILINKFENKYNNMPETKKYGRSAGNEYATDNEKDIQQIDYNQEDHPHKKKKKENHYYDGAEFEEELDPNNHLTEEEIARRNEEVVNGLIKIHEQIKKQFKAQMNNPPGIKVNKDDKKRIKNKLKKVKEDNIPFELTVNDNFNERTGQTGMAETQFKHTDHEDLMKSSPIQDIDISNKSNVDELKNLIANLQIKPLQGIGHSESEFSSNPSNNQKHLWSEVPSHHAYLGLLTPPEKFLQNAFLDKLITLHFEHIIENVRKDLYGDDINSNNTKTAIRRILQKSQDMLDEELKTTKQNVSKEHGV